MDKEYWDEIYRKGIVPEEPSEFAKFCRAGGWIDGKTVLEIGCGNGRDAYYIANYARLVYGVDQSESAIGLNLKKRDRYRSAENLRFIVGDFTDPALYRDNAFDVVYSRFSLHAVHYREQYAVIELVWKHLDRGGVFLVEARSNHDELFAAGVDAGTNTRMTDHKRCFLDFQEFCGFARRLGFEIADSVENKGLARYKSEDPTIIRAVLRK